MTQSRMKIIGITGGIGSGKTTAAKLFSDLYTVPIIDADSLSKKAAERKDVIESVRKHFGPGCVDASDRIDRKQLGEIIFSDEDKRKQLNAIIHPVVMDEYCKQVEMLRQSDAKLVIYDCPLLIEEHLQDSVDNTVLIYADVETRIARIMERNQMTREDALARIQAQMDLDEKIKFADIVLYNTGTVDDLKNAMKYLYKEVMDE